MESVSSTCMPHTGSRTSRRAAVGDGIPSEASPGCGPGACWFWNMPLTMGRKSHKPQESTSSQNKKRIARARKFIGISVCQAARLRNTPANRCESSVCKAKRVSQTKRRNFKRLRANGTGAGEAKRRGNLGLYKDKTKLMKGTGPSNGGQIAWCENLCSHGRGWREA